jgi:Tfp pilus assembly protein PilV
MFTRAGRRYRQKLSNRGFSVVEVLLAATVFGFLVTGLCGAIIYGRQGTANAGDRSRAVFLAEGGCEAVRNIRDAGYANLTNGTFGLVASGSHWVLSGSSDTIGIYTRQITITELDSNRKRITCTVSWNSGGAVRSTSVNTRLTNWGATIAPPTGPTMIAYSKTTNTPYYSIWDGSSWGAEGSAMTVGGTINYIALKSAASRDEAILGTQDASGAIYFQAWGGTSWGNRTQVGTGSTTTRSFDIAYEKATGRALIVYTPTAGSADFAYRIWNGTTLSSPTTVTAPPTTGAISWIEMDQNPLGTSNEIALIMIDANNDIYGMRWTGSAWNNMGTGAVWDATASTATRKGIDVEYEQVSGDILFAWGDATSTDNYYRTWNGTTLSSATLLDIAGMGGQANWVQLAARPSSNEIMLGVQDANSSPDLNTRKWSGTGWDTATQHPEHDASTENINSRNFDIIWETHASNPGVAWVLWGNGSAISSRRWSGTAWGTVSNLTGSDDTSFIKLRADPVSGTVLTGNYQNAASAGTARDITARQLTGGGSTWPAKTVLWGGPTTTDPVYFRVDVATP